MSTAAEFFEQVASTLRTAEANPHGPPVDSDGRAVAGHACVDLCGGDQDKARTLWKLVAQDCGGYMPLAAAYALIRASRAEFLVPDVTPTGDLAPTS